MAVSPQDAPKTASTCSSGLFQFKVLPFGCCNGPPTFQRLMDSLLCGLSWKICLLYLDDVIVFSNTFEEHVHNLGLVLTGLHEAGLKVAQRNVTSFNPKLIFLAISFLGTESPLTPQKLSVSRIGPDPKM